MNAGLKLAIEAGPLVVFFVANAQLGLFPATGAFMVATLVALAAGYILERKLAVMPLVSGAFVLVFGGLTLYLQDALFIKIKPTLVNSLFAIILFGGLAFGKSLLKPLFGAVMLLEDEGWHKLTLRWACFFVFLAIVNEVVWRNFDEDFWISFKLFGIMPLTMLFAMAQMGLMRRYALEGSPFAADTAKEGPEDGPEDGPEHQPEDRGNRESVVTSADKPG